MSNKICLPHVFNQHDIKLKECCEAYYTISKNDIKERKKAKSQVSYQMRLLFQNAEILSEYNYERTRELLQWIRDNPDYPEELRDIIKKNGTTPNCRQLSINYMRFSANTAYREKWDLLCKQIVSRDNCQKAKIRFGEKAGYYECCIEFLLDNGLEQFWTEHREYLKKFEKPEVHFTDAEFVNATFYCASCPDHDKRNEFMNTFLAEALSKA